MRVVVGLAIGAALISTTVAHAQIAWPSEVYSARAAISCKGQTGRSGGRVCSAAFQPVAAGKLLTVTLVSCAIWNPALADQLEDLHLDAAPSSPLRAGDVGFPRIHLLPERLPSGDVFQASLVGEAYYAGGLTPTVTIGLRKDEATWSSIRLDCTMQGRLTAK